MWSTASQNNWIRWFEQICLHSKWCCCLTEPVVLQKFKVVAPTDPDRVVTIIGNANPDDKVRIITPADILAEMSYFLNLAEGLGRVDDIDHLGNRRIVPLVNCLPTNCVLDFHGWNETFANGCLLQDNDVLTPQQIINIRPVTAAVKEFFGSSQLSQFMDQHNPLSELSHNILVFVPLRKRRLIRLRVGVVWHVTVPAAAYENGEDKGLQRLSRYG